MGHPHPVPLPRSGRGDLGAAAAREPQDAGWRAALTLGFAARDGATRIARREHLGPLVVQRAFFPEGPGVAHVYVLHPPGGLVAGDALSLAIDVDAGAHALVTTPAAGKAYRSDGARASRLEQRFAVAGTLEWFPQETIVFDGARVDLTTRVELAANARFAGWEIVCLGRPASGESFTRGLCRQRFELCRAGQPLVIDRVALPGGGALLTEPYGLGGQPVLGTMMVAPAAGELAEIRAAATLGPGERATATVVGDGAALVCRYLGGSGERARAFFSRVWSIVRPAACGRAACPPRIWMT